MGPEKPKNFGEDGERPPEREPNSYEVTPEDIERIWGSRQLRKATLETIKKSRKYNREFGFEIYKNIRMGRLMFGKPIGGETPSSTNAGTLFEEFKQKILSSGEKVEDFLTVGSVHVHKPFAAENNTIYPSSGDIDAFNRGHREANQVYAGFDVPTINMILHCLSDKEALALVMREDVGGELLNKPVVFQELLETMDALSDERASQEEVIRILEHYGYTAKVVRFIDGSLRKEDLDFLKSLAFSAKKWGEEEGDEV